MKATTFYDFMCRETGLSAESLRSDDYSNYVKYIHGEARRECGWSAAVGYNKLYGRTCLTPAEVIVLRRIIRANWKDGFVSPRRRVVRK